MKTKVVLQIGSASDIGLVRSENQDHFGIFREDFGTLIVVCDGIGGYAGGALASQMAVSSIKEYFDKLNKDFDPKDAINKSIYYANKQIIDYAVSHTHLAGMGTTIVVLLIINNLAYYAHVGDSRLYYMNTKEIRQLTKDHSLVQQLIDARIITEDAAQHHPKKNILTQALGLHNSHPTMAEPLEIFENDCFLICTDGLSNYLTRFDMWQISKKADAHSASYQMIETALQRGGDDNITVVLIKIEAGDHKPEDPQLNRRVNEQFAYSFLLFLTSLIFFLYTFYPLFT